MHVVSVLVLGLLFFFNPRIKQHPIWYWDRRLLTNVLLDPSKLDLFLAKIKKRKCKLNLMPPMWQHGPELLYFSNIIMQRGKICILESYWIIFHPNVIMGLFKKIIIMGVSVHSHRSLELYLLVACWYFLILRQRRPFSLTNYVCWEFWRLWVPLSLSQKRKKKKQLIYTNEKKIYKLDNLNRMFLALAFFYYFTNNKKWVMKETGRLGKKYKNWDKIILIF